MVRIKLQCYYVWPATSDSKAIELRTPMYQRVYQYLKLLELKDYSQLEKFTFVGTLKGSDKECLETIIKLVQFLRN